MFPINLIFLTPSNFKYFLVSWLEGKLKLNFSKIPLEKFPTNFHLLNVFFVILAFRRIKGIFFSDKFIMVFGQISESMKKAADGFQ